MIERQNVGKYRALAGRLYPRHPTSTAGACQFHPSNGAPAASSPDYSPQPDLHPFRTISRRQSVTITRATATSHVGQAASLRQTSTMCSRGITPGIRKRIGWGEGGSGGGVGVGVGREEGGTQSCSAPLSEHLLTPLARQEQLQGVLGGNGNASSAWPYKAQTLMNETSIMLWGGDGGGCTASGPIQRENAAKASGSPLIQND